MLKVACARAADSHWLATSLALPGIIADGSTLHSAVEKLRRLAEGIVCEPVKALVTVLDEEHALLW